MSGRFPRLSIIVPVRPGGSVEAVLDGVMSWGYPVEHIELILAEGNMPSRQRNLAAQAASGEVLVFLDNDSLPAESWVQRLLEDFAAHPEAVGVGGPNVTPAGDNLWQRMYGCALASRFAHASMASRYRPIGKRRSGGEKELILCGMAVRAASFHAVGGFDETLFPNEENEFMNRLTRTGHVLIYDPELVVYRSRRRTVVQFFRQMMKYGRGRMEQTFIERFHPGNAFFLAPLGFTCYLASVPLVGSWWYSVPLVVYFMGGLVSAVGFALRERSAIYAALLPFVYTLMHIAYSAGLVKGFLTRALHGVTHPNPTVTIQHYKRFEDPWKV